jgi:hypothetical protein
MSSLVDDLRTPSPSPGMRCTEALGELMRSLRTRQRSLQGYRASNPADAVSCNLRQMETAAEAAAVLAGLITAVGVGSDAAAAVADADD